MKLKGLESVNGLLPFEAELVHESNRVIVERWQEAEALLASGRREAAGVREAKRLARGMARAEERGIDKAAREAAKAQARLDAEAARAAVRAQWRAHWDGICRSPVESEVGL